MPSGKLRRSEQIGQPDTRLPFEWKLAEGASSFPKDNEVTPLDVIEDFAHEVVAEEVDEAQAVEELRQLGLVDK